MRQNQEREEKLAKATERKKRGKLKNKQTGTSTKKKDLMPSRGRKKVDEEDGSGEEVEEIIEEVEGSGSDVEEVIEEVEVTDSEDED